MQLTRWSYLLFVSGQSFSVFFGNTSLPRASTRWLDQRIQAFLHSKKCCWVISVKTRMNHSSEKFFITPRIDPAAAGLETQMLPLCYDAPLSLSNLDWAALVRLFFHLFFFWVCLQRTKCTAAGSSEKPLVVAGIEPTTLRSWANSVSHLTTSFLLAVVDVSKGGRWFIK